MASELFAHLEHLMITTAFVMDLRGASIEDRELLKESVEYALEIEAGFLDEDEDDEPRREAWIADVWIWR